MAKRFAIIFFITIGIVLFVLTGSVLIMFLAPGTEIFGLKYIAYNTHFVKGGANLTTSFGSDFDTIEVYANEVQINVCFVDDSLSYTVYYEDNYSGITDSKIDNPNLIVTQSGKTIRVDVQEYNTIIFRNANTKRFLNINIPIDFVSVVSNQDQLTTFNKSAEGGRSQAYGINLKICTNSSLIKFEYDKTAGVIPTLNTLHIETNGEVDTEEAQIKCLNYELVTGNSAYFSSYPGTRINAKNFNVVAGGSVRFYGIVVGNISAESKNGDVLFVRCADFKAVTNVGKVGASTVDGTRATGNVNIKTYTGDVVINTVEGSGTSKIETVSGDITINKAENASAFNISTRRGFVKLGVMKNAAVSTDIGSVTVEKASESLAVKTVRGNIFAGTGENEVNNLKAETVLGKVEANNVSGNLNVKTEEKGAKIIGKSISNTQIDVGGSLYITGVRGGANIKVAGSSEIWFATDGLNPDHHADDNCTITAGEGCALLKVYLPGNRLDDTRCSVTAASIDAFSANETAYETFTKKTNFNKTNKENDTSLPLLQIVAKSSHLAIYFAK